MEARTYDRAREHHLHTRHKALLPRFRGILIGPNDTEYDEARRFWNGRFNKRPALIARCKSPADVIEVVRFARSRDIPVSVRSGSHDLSERLRALKKKYDPTKFFRANQNIAPAF